MRSTRLTMVGPSCGDVLDVSTLLLPAPVPLSFDAPLLDVRASSLDSGAAVKPSESLDAPEELDAGTGSEPNRIERREIGGCRRCCGSRGCGGSLPSRGRPSSLASSSSSNGSAVVSPDASIAGSISVSAVWMVGSIGGSIDRSTRTLVERLALLQSMRESIVRWHCHLASQLLRSIRSTLMRRSRWSYNNQMRDVDQRACAGGWVASAGAAKAHDHATSHERALEMDHSLPPTRCLVSSTKGRNHPTAPDQQHHD